MACLVRFVQGFALHDMSTGISITIQSPNNRAFQYATVVVFKVDQAMLLRGGKMRGVTLTTILSGTGDIFARGGGNTQEFLYAMLRTRALLISLGNLHNKQDRALFSVISAVEEFLTRTSLVFEY